MAETPATRLWRLRKEAKMTQRALAAACGWEPLPSRVSNYERGERPIDIAAATDLARALKTSPEVILFGTQTQDYDALIPRATHEEVELVQAFRELPKHLQHELREQLMADAERYRQYAKEVLQRQESSTILSNERAAEVLSPAPKQRVAPKREMLARPSRSTSRKKTA